MPESPVPQDDLGLDNPVYAALSTAHSRLAQRCGRALRYPTDMVPFLGLPLAASNTDWEDAARLLDPGGAAAIIQPEVRLPETWTATQVFDVVQMTGEQADGFGHAPAVSLGEPDVPEMLELVRVTNPGPFMNRTIELGQYLGIRRDGILVAMAGERLRLDGWTEISAVCTAPVYRGHGMASQLISSLLARIERRGELGFLHALTDNENAIRLYETLGFRTRRTLAITVTAPRLK